MINEDLTKKIIKCAYTVHNTLGSGFLKKVYENALSIELKKAGYKVQTQYPISVYYDDEVLVEFYADVVITSYSIHYTKLYEKAAVLMITMGKEYAAKIFKFLSEEEVEQLTLSITSMRRVDPEVKETVIDEFMQMS